MPTTIFGAETSELIALPGNHLPEVAKAPTGTAGLDEDTGGGLPRGRPTLVCGPPGGGKTLLGTEFLVRGISTFGAAGGVLAFEESAPQIIRNVASVGVDLERWIHAGLLQLHCVRPGLLGLQAHLFTLQNLVTEFQPSPIEIIDLVKRPLLAREDDIIAIPTLVRSLPAPMRKIIGDLSTTDRVLLSLQVAGAVE